MTTPRTRAIVSRAATLVVGLALAACARNPSPVTRDAAAAVPDRLRTIRFDNEAQGQVYVFLVSEQRDWLLGRVEPGARASLRLPVASLESTTGFVRLAVVPGAPLAVLGPRDPRATFTIAQPTSSLLSQRWTFARRQLTPPELFGAQADARRPRRRP